MLRLLFILVSLALPLRAAEVAPVSLPRASAAETVGLAGVARWLASPAGRHLAEQHMLSDFAGWNPADPQASLALGPLAQTLRASQRLPLIVRLPELQGDRRTEAFRALFAARAVTALTLERRIQELRQAVRSGQVSAEQLSELESASAGWTFYGETVSASAAALRAEARERRLSPLLRDPFSKQEAPAVQAAGPSAPSEILLAPAQPHDVLKTPPPAPPQPPKKSDLGIRALGASLLVPGILAAVHAGGLVFTGVALAISLLSLSEFAALLKKGGRPVSRIGVLLGGGALSLALVAGWPVVPALAAVAGASAAAELWAKTPSIERAAATVFGSALFGLLPTHLALLRMISPHGAGITLAVFGAAWAADTSAYFFGKRFGHRKIAPRVSPNKTWEGAFAGLLAAVAVPLAIAFAAPAWLPLGAAIKIGLIMGTIGQLGGYVNSLIKRANGAKDSGKLLPGHGGAIDRFDSYLLSAALLYYWLR